MAVDESGVKFLLELRDQMTAEARKAREAVADLRGGLEALKPSTAKAEGGLDSLAEKFVFITEAASRVFEGLKRVGEVGFELGKQVVEIASFKTATENALSTMLHSREAGIAAVKEINALAEKTPFTDEAVTKSVKDLVGAGYGVNEAVEAFKGLGDVSTIAGDPAALDALVGTFVKIRAEGKFTARELKAVLVDSKGAVSKDALAKLLGFSPEGLDKAVEEGKVSADAATKAVLASVKSGISGGELGSVMAAAGQQIPGLLTKLKEIPFSLIPSVDESTGLSSFRSFLQNLVKVFDTEGTFGARLKSDVESVIDYVFGAFDELGSADGLTVLEDAFGEVLDGLETIGSIIDTVWPPVKAFFSGLIDGFGDAITPLLASIKAVAGMSSGASGLTASMHVLGEVLGWTVGLLADIAAALGFVGGVVYTGMIKPFVDFAGLLGTIVGYGKQAFGALSSWLEGLDWADIGSSLIDGLWDGIKSGFTILLDSFEGLIDLLPETARSALGIASPSKVFHGIGFDIGEGAEQGVVAKTPDVRASMADMIAPPGANAFDAPAPFSFSGASSDDSAEEQAPTTTVTLNLTFNVAGDMTKKSAQESGGIVLGVLRDAGVVPSMS